MPAEALRRACETIALQPSGPSIWHVRGYVKDCAALLGYDEDLVNAPRSFGVRDLCARRARVFATLEGRAGLKNPNALFSRRSGELCAAPGPPIVGPG